MKAGILPQGGVNVKWGGGVAKLQGGRVARWQSYRVAVWAQGKEAVHVIHIMVVTKGRLRYDISQYLLHVKSGLYFEVAGWQATYYPATLPRRNF